MPSSTPRVSKKSYHNDDAILNSNLFGSPVRSLPNPRDFISRLTAIGMHEEERWRKSKYDAEWFAILRCFNGPQGGVFRNRVAAEVNELNCTLTGPTRTEVSTVRIEAEIRNPRYASITFKMGLRAMDKLFLNCPKELKDAFSNGINVTRGYWSVERKDHQEGYNVVANFNLDRDEKSAAINTPLEIPSPPPAAEPKTPAKKTVVDPAPFMEAAFNGNLEAIRKAIEAGVDVNATDEQGNSALLWASFNGHTPVVEVLLEKGASLSHRSVVGRTALMFASTGANAETVELLIGKGAEINAFDTEEKFTALMHAAAEGQVKVVQVLLKAKADPDLRDADGETALDFARKKGHAAVVQLLTK